MKQWTVLSLASIFCILAFASCETEGVKREEPKNQAPNEAKPQNGQKNGQGQVQQKEASYYQDASKAVQDASKSVQDASRSVQESFKGN